MEQRFVEYLHDSFNWLNEKYGFIKADEVNDQQAYWIEYRSDIFTLKLEKYRREFYATVYKTTGNPDRQINLFNLLSYLNQTSPNFPVANYFPGEEDLGECYRKQFKYLSNTIFDNFAVIAAFFNSENYESKMLDLRNFIVNKSPNLFKRI